MPIGLLGEEDRVQQARQVSLRLWLAISCLGTPKICAVLGVEASLCGSDIKEKLRPFCRLPDLERPQMQPSRSESAFALPTASWRLIGQTAHLLLINTSHLLVCPSILSSHASIHIHILMQEVFMCRVPPPNEILLAFAVPLRYVLTVSRLPKFDE